MQLRRNEILTGILVVATIVVLTAVLIMLGAPGLFRPLVTYRIYMDNAAGIKLGAPVLLAGRKIGQVDRLYSPISKDEAGKALEMSAAIRPPPDPNAAPALQPRYEARIDVRVDKSAMVYKDAHTRLITLGLLGEMAIDITQGSDAAGRAQDGQMFAGERVPEFGETIAKVIDMLQPVAKEASATLKELQATASNLGKITDENSSLNMALAQMRTFAENLTTMTSSDSPLQLALKNVETISGNLNKISTDIASNENIPITLANFRRSSEDLKNTIHSLGPDLSETVANAKQFTDTVKHQPWRLIFPTTKKYPEDEQANAQPNEITVRQTTKRQGGAAATQPRKRRETQSPGG